MAQSGFSLPLFKALLDALQPSGSSTRIVITIAMNNLEHAASIVDIIERRMSHVGLESADLKMLWVVVDHLMKAAPLIYPHLFAQYIPSMVADRVPWDSDDALAVSLWVQRIVATWVGLLPEQLWRSQFDSIRQRRTRMYLERKGENGMVDGDVAMGDEDDTLGSAKNYAATVTQIEGLKASWAQLVSLVTPANRDAPNYDGEPDTKRSRVEGAGGSTSVVSGTSASGTGAEADEDDSDFDLGKNDEFDVGGNPIMALPEIQLAAAARQPRRRR